MKRDISEKAEGDSAVLDDQAKQEERLKRFQAGRAQVWAGREGFTDMSTEAQGEKEGTEREREGALARIEERQKRIDELQGEISQKKESWINRLVEFRKIRDLEEKLQMTERMKNLAGEDKKRTDELIAAYDFIIAEGNDLTSIKSEVKTELQARDEERFAAMEQDEKARGIETLAQKHQCFFVHDIVDADWKPSENNRAVDTKGLSWDDQLDILVGLEPTISASSLQEGVRGDGTFGRGSWGAFIGEGKVLGGATGDIGTRAYGLYDREVPSNARDLNSIDRAIDRQSRRTGNNQDKSYNELVVERPQVAGIYFKWSDSFPPLAEITSLQNTKSSGYDGWWKRLKSVTEKNVPVFVLTPDNHTRLIHGIDFEKRTFQLAQVDVRPEDMADLPGIYQQHLGTTEKRTMAMRQINRVRHLISPEKAKGIEEGMVYTKEDMKSNPYALH